MRTLDLKEAAHFLRMHPEEVRRRAKEGVIPGAKIGRAWVFIDLDLADFLRSFYSACWQALQVTLRKGFECHFASADQSGGLSFVPSVGSEYDNLLGLTKKPSPKSCTTR